MNYTNDERGNNMIRDNIQYVNGVQVGASMYDFYIDCFNKLSDDDNPTLKPFLTLAMSPQHFKKMCLALNSMLQEYEKLIGNIDVPDESKFK